MSVIQLATVCYWKETQNNDNGMLATNNMWLSTRIILAGLKKSQLARARNELPKLFTFSMWSPHENLMHCFFPLCI